MTTAPQTTHIAVAGWLLAHTHCGASRRLEELLRAALPLLAANERLTLLCSASGPRPSQDHRLEHVVVSIPPRPTWRRALAEARVLPGVLAEIGADVLDLQSLPVPARLPCPVLLTVHDVRDLTELRRRPRALSRFVLRRSVARAAHVVVPSAFVANALHTAVVGLRPPLTIVPGGVSDMFFGASPAAVDAAPRPASPFFLHVGHLERRKNLDLLLRAYARFAAMVPATATIPDLVLAGADRGEARRLRARATALSIADRVRFAPSVDDAQLLALYAGANAVLVPSLHEGFGLPVLEALAMGRPTFVSDRGALPEIAGAVGRVLPADDEVAWADALLEATRADEDEATRRRRQSHARGFRWDAAAARLVAAWRAAAASAR